MEKYKNKDVFKIYAATLATSLHYDILQNINNLDSPNAADLYIKKIKTYANNLKKEYNMKNFIALYSDLYTAYMKKKRDNISKAKDFINLWYDINNKNNNTINNNISSILYKINISTINKLLQDYFPHNAEKHINMFIISSNPKHEKDVTNFDNKYHLEVINALAISCYNFNNQIQHNNELTTVPIESYLSVTRELEKLKSENSGETITKLKNKILALNKEIEELKNKIEMLELEKDNTISGITIDDEDI